MDKRITGLLGAAAALTTMASAQAAPASTEPAPTSYRDLLNPVPDAVPMLRADNARLTATPATEVAQIVVGVGHHHHHHHHARRHHHHHHHHHD
jgi:hypothetical protein